MSDDVKKPKEIGVAAGCLVIIIGAVVMFKVIGWVSSPNIPMSMPPAPQPESATQAPTPSKVVHVSPLFNTSQRETAKATMEAVRSGHRVYEEGSHLVVEMGRFLDDRNHLLGFARRVADADCVLEGKPRNIYFYDPSMKKVAQSDTINGIRLTD